MVNILLRSDPSRVGWYIPAKAQPFGSHPWRIALHSHVWRPPTDVYETESVVVVRVEIAGMREEDFTISLSDKYLVIRGLRPDVPERRAYYQMEIVFGEFMSEIELPCDVNAEQARAEYKAGFLRLELPKVQARRIRVED